MKTQIIKVSGMSCSHCKGSVSNLFSQIEGVKSADVSLEEGMATIEFDPNLIDLDVILERFNQSHYEASLD